MNRSLRLCISVLLQKLITPRPLLLRTIPFSVCSAASQIVPPTISPCSRHRYMSSKSTKSAEEKLDEDDLDAPIQYTTSKASQWKAAQSHNLGVETDTPWFQAYIVSFSMGCLLIWYGILREENDKDEEMKKPLWERVPGLEKTQLNTVINYNRERGLPTADLEERLAYLETLDKK